MTGYRWVDDRWEEEGPLGDGEVAPMGGLWSSVRDLAAWISFFLDAFPPRDGADAGPLSRASRREMQQAHRAFPSAYDEATGRLDAGGYGYGLAVTHDLRFGHVVHHAGGLPGFGSHMAWVPDLGLGAVALGNVTYAPASHLTRELLELVADAGGLRPPAVHAPALERAADALARLLAEWDDVVADRVFAPNVDLDEPRERRRAEAERIRGALGPFRAADVEATTATRGFVRLIANGAEAMIWITLTPEPEARIQTYRIDGPDGGTV
jgi:CubicO group peptidase (beta-lactamase class C family)